MQANPQELKPLPSQEGSLCTTGSTAATEIKGSLFLNDTKCKAQISNKHIMNKHTHTPAQKISVGGCGGMHFIKQAQAQR